jgi:hypothetical protein
METTVNKYEEQVLKAFEILKTEIHNRTETIKKIDSAVVKAGEKIKALTATLETIDPFLKPDIEKLIAEQHQYIEKAKEWRPREEQMLRNLYINKEFFQKQICPHAHLEMTETAGKHVCLTCGVVI